MKRQSFFSTLLIIILCMAIACSRNYYQHTPGEKWPLTWEENFNGNSLDLSRWTKIPRCTSDWNRYMSAYDSLYEVKNGNLILRGVTNTSQLADTASYLTGGVYTKDKANFGYGRLEIRAKLNSAKGAWPAFWMLPATGRWPHGGEIDIMERLNFDAIAYQTVHSHYTYNLKIKSPAQGATMPIKPDDYNIYAVEKHKDSLVFFVNGKRSFTYPRIETDKEGQFPFDQSDFYLLLDMQLGGTWVGAIDNRQLPVEMYIDWVRFYELK